MAGAVQAGSDEIRIATNVWPGYQPFYLIDEHAPAGLSRRLELIRYWSASEVTSALEIGLVDMAGLTLDEAVAASARGNDLLVLAVLDVSSGADVICTMDPASSPRDRIYAHESTAVGEYFLYLFLAHNGLTLADVRRVNSSVEEHLGLLQRGAADTFLTYAPFTAELLAEGCVPVFDSSQLGPSIIDVLVMRKDRYDSRMQADVAALIASYQQIAERIRQQDPEIAPDLAEGLGVAPSEVYGLYDGLVLPTAAEGEAILAADSFHALISDIHVWLHETGRTDLQLPDLLTHIAAHGTTP